MKLRKFHVLVLILVALIIGGAIWLFSRGPGGVTIDTYTEASLAQADVPKAATPVAPVAQVELPKAAAVGAKEGTDDSKAEAAALTQAELKATVKDMAYTLREKGGFSFDMAFDRPDFAARMHQQPQYMQLMLQMEADDKQNPQIQLKNELTAQKYDYLATLTPTLNAAGDKATYFGNPPSEDAKPGDPPKKIEILMKIDGKWYCQLDWSGE